MTGKRMLKSAREALAYARSETNDEYVVHVPGDIDVKEIRKRPGIVEELLSDAS